MDDDYERPAIRPENRPPTLPKLPPELEAIGATLLFHPPEDGAPDPFIIYSADDLSDDGLGEYLGSGETAQDAIDEALAWVAE